MTLKNINCSFTIMAAERRWEDKKELRVPKKRKRLLAEKCTITSKLHTLIHLHLKL